MADTNEFGGRPKLLEVFVTEHINVEEMVAAEVEGKICVSVKKFDGTEDRTYLWPLAWRACECSKILMKYIKRDFGIDVPQDMGLQASEAIEVMSSRPYLSKIELSVNIEGLHFSLERKPKNTVITQFERE